MSKHGTIITCSYCGGKGHNKGGCNLKKAGLRPKLLVQRGPNVQLEETIEKTHASGDPNVSQVSMQLEEGSQPLLSQMSNTMLSQMKEES